MMDDSGMEHDHMGHGTHGPRPSMFSFCRGSGPPSGVPQEAPSISADLAVGHGVGGPFIGLQNMHRVEDPPGGQPGW